MPDHTSAHLLDKLVKHNRLKSSEWASLIENEADLYDLARKMAQEIALQNFERKIFYRGIIEFTNFCQNDCLYCGLRKSNHDLKRYRLTNDEIIECGKLGYEFGIKTFVLQGGEDLGFSDDKLIEVILDLKSIFDDVQITLSVGERSFYTYQRFFEAGARRYLLRHETADFTHYAKLHPEAQPFWHRITCLYNLKKIGFQTGCGMMIGSPNQTTSSLVQDLCFIQDFKPEMLGMGPFLPHHSTPFKTQPSGSARQTLYILALVRLMAPKILLPATTALKTLLPNGYAEGILSGCNVIMPNISPDWAKPNYELYNGKLVNDLAQSISKIRAELKTINYQLVSAKGDFQG